MDASSRWFSLAEVNRAYINCLLQHAPDLHETARVLGMSDRHLYDVRREHNLIWVPPASRTAGWLAPSTEVLEIITFLLAARRTGQTISVPDEMLLRWIKARPEMAESFRRLLAPAPVPAPAAYMANPPASAAAAVSW